MFISLNSLDVDRRPLPNLFYETKTSIMISDLNLLAYIKRLELIYTVCMMSFGGKDHTILGHYILYI